MTLRNRAIKYECHAEHAHSFNSFAFPKNSNNNYFGINGCRMWPSIVAVTRVSLPAAAKTMDGTSAGGPGPRRCSPP